MKEIKIENKSKDEILTLVNILIDEFDELVISKDKVLDNTYEITLKKEGNF